MSHKEPTFNGSAFNCPHCGAFAHMTWQMLVTTGTTRALSDAVQATCSHCQEVSIWIGYDRNPLNAQFESGKMVYPNVVAVTMAHPDMPNVISQDYEEARTILHQSPRAACALLRLCVQKLCSHLGEPGKNINDDIGALVKKGLPPEVQQALDIVRVVGNNSVHPGSISEQDIESVASSLFELVNYIVEDRIARPAKLASMFSTLPETARAGIESRDGRKG